MIESFTKGEIDFERLRVAAFGGQEYEGDFHFTGFTTETIVELLERAQFSQVEVIDRARPNGDCLELEIRAIRER